MRFGSLQVGWGWGWEAGGGGRAGRLNLPNIPPGLNFGCQQQTPNSIAINFEEYPVVALVACFGGQDRGEHWMLEQ